MLRPRGARIIGAMRILDVDELAAADAPALTAHLLDGEAVHAAFLSPTATVLFTERRILLIERNALLNERIETSSFSYRAVTHFSVVEPSGDETRGAIKVWLGTDPQPLHLRANAGTDLAGLQRLLASRLV